MRRHRRRGFVRAGGRDRRHDAVAAAAGGAAVGERVRRGGAQWFGALLESEEAGARSPRISSSRATGRTGRPAL